MMIPRIVVNRFLFYFVVVILLVAFEASIFVKIVSLITAVVAVMCWELGLFKHLPLIGWLFERNLKC